MMMNISGVAHRLNDRLGEIGDSLIAFIRLKIWEAKVRKHARYLYYRQFSSVSLSVMYIESESMQNMGSINDVMEERGYRFNFKSESFESNPKKRIVDEAYYSSPREVIPYGVIERNLFTKYGR